MKTANNKRQRTAVRGRRSESKGQKTTEESECSGKPRRTKAAMNCTGRRIFGDILILSPQRLNKERKVAEIQKTAGVLRTRAEKIKAAKIPIPPPFGITPSWELRSFDLSKRPMVVPQREISQAPAPPRIGELKYKIKLSTDYANFRRSYINILK